MSTDKLTPEDFALAQRFAPGLERRRHTAASIKAPTLVCLLGATARLAENDEPEGDLVQLSDAELDLEADIAETVRADGEPEAAWADRVQAERDRRADVRASRRSMLGCA